MRGDTELRIGVSIPVVGRVDLPFSFEREESIVLGTIMPGDFNTTTSVTVGPVHGTLPMPQNGDANNEPR